MTTRPLAATVSAWLGYVLAFSILHATVINDVAAVFLLVPLGTTAWYFGLAGGIAAATVMWPVQIALFLLGDHDLGWDMLVGVEGAVGLLCLASTAVVAGHISDRLRGAELDAGERTRLVATVSHEVRNPLTGVIGLSDTLLEQWDDLDRSEARDLIELISAEAHSMSAIVEDLLEFSRLSSGALQVKTEAMDLGDIAREVCAHASGEARVVGDPSRVRQIVRNLVDNARRHGGDSIQVTIGASPKSAWMEVSDDGPEIEPELRAQLFTPFATSGKPGSTGLGLAVSRELAMAMGGDITHRRDGGRTVFKLELLPARTSQLV